MTDMRGKVVVITGGTFGIGRAKISGVCFYRCRPVEPSAEAQDNEAARRLWEESIRLAL